MFFMLIVFIDTRATVAFYPLQDKLLVI